jgi:nucleoside-diphosphate-sugar epimerase
LKPLLVLGVQDALGLATIRQLKADGHRVISGDGAGLSPGIRPYDAVAFLSPLVADPCSAVAHHLGASGRARHAKALTTLAEIVSAGHAPRLVLRSSTSLYADHQRNWVTESGVIELADATRQMASAERLAVNHARRGGDSVILRLAHPYGPADAWTDKVLRLASRGWQPFDGPDDAYFPLVHVDDAARAVARALVAPEGVYNVAEPRPATNGELNQVLAGMVGRGRLHPLWPSIRRADRDLAMRSRRVDASRLKDVTGWHATVAPNASLGFAAVTNLSGHARKFVGGHALVTSTVAREPLL